MFRDPQAVQKGPGKITITRRSGTGEADFINILIEDKTSGIVLIEAALTMQHFGNVITGFASQPCELEYTHTPNFGLKAWHEHRKMAIPRGLKDSSFDYGHSRIREYIQQHGQEEGWLLDTYLGSQSSFSYDGKGEAVANYRVYKYVTPEEYDVLNAKYIESLAKSAVAKVGVSKGRKRG